MNSIQKLTNAGAAAEYYLNNPVEAYYLNRQEQTGWWHGSGASRLGLRNQVEGESFRHLLAGFSADGLNPLVQNAGKNTRQPGWDLTLSAPKSVSVLWALLSKKQRKVIRQIHEKAVKEALDRVELICGASRTGKGGKTLEKASLVFGCFTDHTSRALDMDLHTHCVLVNTGVREDGSTGALYSELFYEFKIAIGQFYRDRLQEHLLRDVGLTTSRERVGFHVEGVPKELCREHSKRRIAIEQKMAQTGTSGAIAAKQAAIETRPGKQKVSLQTLHEQWTQAGERHGFGRKEAEALLMNASHNHDRSIRTYEELRAAATQSKRQSNSIANFNTRQPDKDKRETLKARSRQSARPKEPPLATIPEAARTEDKEASIAQRQGQPTNLHAINKPVESRTQQESGRKAGQKRKVSARKPSKGALTEQPGDEKAEGNRKSGLHVEYKLLAPTAPEWSPLKLVKLPQIRFGKTKSFKRWDKILWTKDLKVAQLRIQQKVLFPNAPKWSPLSKATIPTIRLLSPSQLRDADARKIHHEKKQQRLQHNH